MRDGRSDPGLVSCAAIFVAVHTGLWALSLRATWVPVAIQPRFTCYRDDDLLDVLRQVRTLHRACSERTHADLSCPEQHRWLYLKPSLRVSGRRQQAEEFIPYRHPHAHVSYTCPPSLTQRSDMPPVLRYRVVFAIVFLLDLFLVAAGSSGAVPFGTSLTRFASGLHRTR